MRTPEDIYAEAYSYMFIVLLGTGATVFYNMISNMLRSLGDSRTPLFFLIFSALLNVVLDIVFILPLNMGVAGAAWATVLSQLLSAVLCTIVGMRNFDVLRTRRADFADWRRRGLHRRDEGRSALCAYEQCLRHRALKLCRTELRCGAVPPHKRGRARLPCTNRAVQRAHVRAAARLP